MNLRDRLRELPAGAFVPPPSAGPKAEAAPKNVVTNDYEYDYQEVEIPSGAAPVLVYTTKRRWSALDVYVSRPKVSVFVPNDVVSIAVFARVGGVRVLVASGRLENEGTLLVDGGLPEWIAAARCQAEFFEVELSFNNLINAGEKIGVAIIASDNALALPDDWSNGDIPLRLTADSSARLAQAVPFLVTGVQAINFSAAAGFVQVHKKAVPIAGDTPLLCFGLGAGQSIYLKGDLLFGRRCSVGVCVIASSTAGTLTALVGSMFVNGWVR